MKNTFNFFTEKQSFLKETAYMNSAQLLNRLDSNFLGLNEEQVKTKVKEHGNNTVDTRNFIWYKKLLRCLVNPFIIILLLIAIYHIVNFTVIKKDNADDARGSKISMSILIVMMFLSVTITYLQDYRSYRSAAKLKAMVTTTTSVLRNIDVTNKGFNLDQLLKLSNQTVEVATHNLVPGDIIFLRAGDVVPADVRILNAIDLFINQATLTGEAELVEKFATVKNKNNADVLATSNLAFMGTSIHSGTCVAVVVNTGKNTYLGNIAKTISGKMPKSAFEKGIKKVTFIFVIAILIIMPILFGLSIYQGEREFWAALTYSLAGIAALTPEMLPMIVSANLARGAVKMSKQKVIVKNLSAIQGFGEMNVLCTDKTGTLTSEEIELVEHLDLNGKENAKVLEWAYLNSFYQTGLKNNIDKTIITHIKSHHDSVVDTPYYKIDEIPFDFARRKMSVAVTKVHDENNLLITKGAVEEILSICTKVEVNDKIVNLDENMKRQVVNLSKKLNEKGLRVIAVCYNKFAINKTNFTVADEKEMVLAGYLGFLDTPKPSAVKAINALYQHGISVKILTGDNEIVTKALCKKMRLEVGEVLLGHEIDKMTDEQLAKVVNKTMIFAKMDPLGKARVIRMLKHNGNTVGFLGDGINDAVALKTADVGICVDSGAEIAKDVADIILLEKDLNILDQGVILGRHTFANILKYIKITFASNLGNVVSAILAIWIVKGITPMAPLAALLQNLLYDISQLAMPWDRVDEEYVKKPRKWEPMSFGWFAMWNGPLSSVFDVTTYLFMGYTFGVFDSIAHGGSKEASENPLIVTFQTGCFVIGLLSQTLIVHVARTSKVPIIQSRSTWPLAVMTFVIIGVGLMLPFLPFADTLGLGKLGGIYYLYLFGALAAYVVSNQGLKVVYKKVYKRWL